jgi:RNA polymerase subunit RPABC4/transcription elongation factor Spt4
MCHVHREKPDTVCHDCGRYLAKGEAMMVEDRAMCKICSSTSVAEDTTAILMLEKVQLQLWSHFALSVSEFRLCALTSFARRTSIAQLQSSGTSVYVPNTESTKFQRAHLLERESVGCVSRSFAGSQCYENDGTSSR